MPRAPAELGSEPMVWERQPVQPAMLVPMAWEWRAVRPPALVPQGGPALPGQREWRMGRCPMPEARPQAARTGWLGAGPPRASAAEHWAARLAELPVLVGEARLGEAAL